VRVMKTVLEKRDEKYAIKVVSRVAGGYQEHARAEARVFAHSVVPLYRVHEAAEGGTETYIGAGAVHNQEAGELGPRWHNLRWVKIGNTEGVARLQLEETFQADVSDFLLHPAMVDMASGFLYMAKKGNRTYLPYYYEQIKIYDRIPAACYCHVILKSQSEDNLTFDVRMVDEGGRMLMEINGYTYKAYVKPAITSRPALAPKATDTGERAGVENAYALTTGQVIFWLEKALASRHKHLVISRQNCEDIDFKSAGNHTDQVTEDEAASPDLVLRERTGMSTAYVEAATPTQRLLAEDWQRFFGIRQIGIQDDFFELGGDSLKSTTIISRINKAFRVAVSLTDFFKNSTVAKLAEYIDQSSQTGVLLLPVKAEKKSFYPLSPAQKRVFFMQQVYKDMTAYNITEAFQLKGALNRERLEQAIEALLTRHDSLRTMVVMIDNTPHQKILASVPVQVEYHEVEEQEISHALYAFRRPFDLDKPPYIRFGVYKTGEHQHHLIVDIFHLIADGTSLLILIKEFWSLYHGEILPRVPLNHIDFTEWQGRLQRTGHFSKQKEFWREYLSGNLELLKLPFDSLAPKDMERTGSNQTVVLSRETTSALKTVIRHYEATEFMLMVALFHTFLSKLTGQHDIITGIPTAGRMHEEFNESVGMFVNTTVIRSKVDGQDTFADILGNVKKNTLQVFDNQDFQYEMIMDMVRQESGRPVVNLFNVILNYRNMFVSGDKTTAKQQTISGNSAALEDTSAKHDLVFFIYDNPDHFTITCNYPTALFDAETITFIIGEFTQLADLVARDHKRTITEYAIFCRQPVITAGHQAAVFDL
jgi:iturin family lipopeptide synthetase A